METTVMKNSKTSVRSLSVFIVATLFHTQLAFGDGCDLPMFAGARLLAAASNGSQFMATADFNHDGFLDVVTTDSSNTLSVLLGNGDGTFQTAVKYPAVNGASSVVMADFNGDGNLDLAVASNGTGSAGLGGAVTVLFGQGDGTFRNSIVYGAGNNPLSMAVGDVNGDGQPDMVVTDSVANTAVVLLNNYVPGSGSVCAPVQPLSN